MKRFDCAGSSAGTFGLRGIGLNIGLLADRCTLLVGAIVIGTIVLGQIAEASVSRQQSHLLRISLQVERQLGFPHDRIGADHIFVFGPHEIIRAAIFALNAREIAKVDFVKLERNRLAWSEGHRGGDFPLRGLPSTSFGANRGAENQASCPSLTSIGCVKGDGEPVRVIARIRAGADGGKDVSAQLACGGTIGAPYQVGSRAPQQSREPCEQESSQKSEDWPKFVAPIVMFLGGILLGLWGILGDWLPEVNQNSGVWVRHSRPALIVIGWLTGVTG
jgi:hypothetical protein